MVDLLTGGNVCLLVSLMHWIFLFHSATTLASYSSSLFLCLKFCFQIPHPNFALNWCSAHCELSPPYYNLKVFHGLGLCRFFAEGFSLISIKNAFFCTPACQILVEWFDSMVAWFVGWLIKRFGLSYWFIGWLKHPILELLKDCNPEEIIARIGQQWE